MRLPQDIANLLAVTIRDVIWYKQPVYSFLESCGVPCAIMLDVARQQRDGKATIKIVHGVLDILAGKGDERVILMDGYDLRCVLNCDMAFDVLLARKQADIVQNQRPFIGATEILKEGV